MRRFLKCKASDKARRVGQGVSAQRILDKLDTDYTTAESTLSVMSKFYACKQESKENVESFSNRLEDLFDQAVHLNCLRKIDTVLLKEKLHCGLNRSLKNLSMYHCDTSDDYDKFKFHLRQLEADEQVSEPKPCKAAIQVSKPEYSRLDKMEELLLKLNEKISRLESGEQKRGQNTFYRPSRGEPIGRGSLSNPDEGITIFRLY